jgi:hypothetical protein
VTKRELKAEIEIRVKTEVFDASLAAVSARLDELERNLYSRGRDEAKPERAPSVSSSASASTPILSLVIEPSPGGWWALQVNGSLMLNSTKERVVAEAARLMAVEDSSGRPHPAVSASVELRRMQRAEVDALKAENERLLSRIADANSLLSRWRVDSETLADARLLLRDAMEPGKWAELDRVLERVRLEAVPVPTDGPWRG